MATKAEKEAGKLAAEQAETGNEESQRLVQEAMKEKEVLDIEDVLGNDEAMWRKRQVQMSNLSMKVYTLVKADFRTNKNGNYYILQLENEDGVPATTTTGSPTISKKVSALENRDAFPVKVRIIPFGNSYDIVSPTRATEGVGS